MNKAINLFGCVFAIFTGSVFAQAPVRPLLEKDKWSFADESAWKWSGTPQEPVLTLVKQSAFKPVHRSPFNLAWFTGRKWGSFTLTAEARLEVFDKNNNDLCIAFGKTSDYQFYYAHLGEKADAVHLQLHIVDNADRKKITETGVAELPWKPETWHRVKLQRDLEKGSIVVFFDGVEVLRATDRSFGEGLIGLGSFDDVGSFRNVEISGN